MAKLPKKYTAEELEPLFSRARMLANKAGMKFILPSSKEMSRSDLRRAERLAYGILSVDSRGICAALAKDVIDLGGNVDSIYRSVLPVFEAVDAMILTGDAVLTAGPKGYELRDRAGELLSDGPTLRSWLLDHLKRFVVEA